MSRCLRLLREGFLRDLWVYRMNREKIIERMFSLQDKEYGALQSRTIPSVEKERIIGVRTPALRSFAKELAKESDVDTFLSSLPHQYFEEDQLHAFVVALEKDFDRCITRVETFLPFIDNWATCDQFSPVAFKKSRRSFCLIFVSGSNRTGHIRCASR